MLGGRGGLHFKATVPDALCGSLEKKSLKVAALTQNCLVTHLILSNKVKLFAGKIEIMVRTCYLVAKLS